MKEVCLEDYQHFMQNSREVEVHNSSIPLNSANHVASFGPKSFDLECTSVWSFPRRGSWATHKGDYRGNWAPEIPRNILLRYSKPGEIVLDQMMGSGTTLVECKLLSRNAIGVDINPGAVMLARNRLDFVYTPLSQELPGTVQKTYVGDARNLDLISPESVDLIATHPPYANIIKYSDKEIDGDLSRIGNIDLFLSEMRKVAKESYRVLKEGRHCAVLVGDTRKNKNYIPIAPRLMESFIETGFILKEDIIKKQWNCKATGFWKERSRQLNFLLIMHEHLYIFQKRE